MCHVYILKSLKDQKLYTGSTNNLERRLEEHHSGKVKSTKFRRPLKLIFCKEFETINDARLFEHQLKHPKAGKTKNWYVLDRSRASGS